MDESTWRVFKRDELKSEYQASRDDYKDLDGMSRSCISMRDNSSLCLFVKNHTTGPAGMATGSRDGITECVLAGVGGTAYTGISKEGQKVADAIYEEMNNPEYDVLIQRLDAELLDPLSRENM
ncbi:hypothetical protein GOV06_01370 [Candidatus Woesearchaeota archaeon]|nr:hypothetical protein [Candidatus Woesearchaeota archaeon]